MTVVASLYKLNRVKDEQKFLCSGLVRWTSNRLSSHLVKEEIRRKGTGQRKVLRHIHAGYTESV